MNRKYLLKSFLKIREVRCLSEFNELIKTFDKVRFYMRDFFIYGFKTRSDFKQKSLRTYDNERRRIESWLGNLITFDTSKKGKQVAISLDSSRLTENPLYKAYKSKSFTDNDIMLHFFLLDLLNSSDALSLEEIADRLNEQYGEYFEPQTIRIKLKEYVKEGILQFHQQGRSYYYSICKDYADTICEDAYGFYNAVSFFTGAIPFGVVGSYIMDKLQAKNNLFLYKHNFIVHTLEDNILFDMTSAMESKCEIEVTAFGKRKKEEQVNGIPLKIFVSTQTGRQYICMYIPLYKRFQSYRLDYIKAVKIICQHQNYNYYMEKLDKNLLFCWGVSFGGESRLEQVRMTLYIDDNNEQYILDRLNREGRNGTITKLDNNTYLYSTQVFDTNEMMPWIKSFTGRILSLECSNKAVVKRFYEDIVRMKKIYDNDEV